jgi:SHS2 domain-containing protein
VYRWVDHTSELELEIAASTKQAVFEEALRAFGQLVSQDSGGEPAEYGVTVSAKDPPALLAEWLGELVFLVETEDFVPERVSAFEFGAGSLSAFIAGRRDEPSHLVKSVTYHSLQLRCSEGVWLARVVLDV